MQSLLLLIAPALFAASIYIVLGRIILLVNGEKYSLIRQKWLTKIFVTGDVISFLVQAGGGGIQAAGSLDLLHAGEKIIVVGLFLQLAFFGFFVVVAGLFHYRFVKADPHPKMERSNQTPDQGSPTDKTQADHLSRSSNNEPVQYYTGTLHHLPWKRHMFALYIASTLIMIRSIFRVVEYVQGNNGYLLQHEVYLYIFDGLLMFSVMCLFNWVHPAEVTDLHQKQLSDGNMVTLQTRDQYMRVGTV